MTELEKLKVKAYDAIYQIERWKVILNHLNTRIAELEQQKVNVQLNTPIDIPGEVTP